MTDNVKQEKGLIDVMIKEYISMHLPKEKLIEIGTCLILEYILPKLRDYPNLFMELNNGAWVISYDYKYGIIVSKGKGLGLKYIAYLLQHKDIKFEPIELMNQFKTTLNDKTSTDQYDVEEGDSIDSGIIGDKLSREAFKDYRNEYINLKKDLMEAGNSIEPEVQRKIETKEAQVKIEEFEEVFKITYKIPAYYLLGKYEKIPKDKSKNLESIKTMVIRDIRIALNLIGEEPNISPLKDYLKRYITRSDKLIYTHDPKLSWEIFLK